MKIDHTNRGFTLIEFKDRNDIECSLQKSSSAMEESIWLGCNDPEPKYQIPGIPGWQRIILPEDCVSNTRMHLSRDQVAGLIPLLQKFVDTGELE